MAEINNAKEDQGEKLIQTLIISKLPSAHEILRRRDVVNIVELFYTKEHNIK